MKIKIKEHRLNYGLSQNQMSKLIGVSHSTFCKIESGKIENPGIKFCIKFCLVCGIPVEDLFLDDKGEYTFTDFLRQITHIKNNDNTN